MKKYSILLAITTLIIASLACQTIMGGGSGGGADDIQIDPMPPIDSGSGGDAPELPNVTVGESPFPVPDDAFNLASTADVVAYQTNLSSDDVIKFYQDEFGKLGYSEDTSMAVNFNGVFTLAFDGHESGRQILLAGAPTGDGSTSVTITFQ